MSRTLRRSASRVRSLPPAPSRSIDPHADPDPLLQPLSDISNLSTARTPTSATIDSKSGPAPASGAPLVDLPLTDSPPFTPNLDADGPLDSKFDSDDDDDELAPPRPFRTSIESRQWKECTPILDDPVGEALAEQSFAASSSPAVASRFGQPLEADCAGSSRDNEPGGDEVDISSARSSSTFEDDERASERSSEDGASTVTTPDTSVPTSSSPWSERCDPHDESADLERPERVGVSTFAATSTPPRPAGRFVELVETCPTPPPRASTSARSRSLLVVASGLGSSSAPDGGDDEVFQSVTSSRRSSGTLSRSRERTRSSSAHSSRPPSPGFADPPSLLLLGPGPSSSYTPSLYPDAAHYDTYTRRPRLRRSLTRIFAREEDGDEDDALAFPPAEALVADLLRAHPAERAAWRASSADEGALEPLRHVRPVSMPGLADGSALRRSSASPAPFSSLIHPQHSYHTPRPSYAAPSPRHHPSSSTLLTYDLSHLPAPDSPRERPYRVSWTDVVRPSAFVRAGRGSGRCGDVWGAVERRVEEPRGRGMDGARGRAGAGRGSEAQGRRWSCLGGAPASTQAPALRPVVEAHGPPPRSSAPRLDESAVLAAPDAPRGGISRSGSLASVRRGLSKLGRRMSWGARAGAADGLEQDGHDERVRDGKAHRRRSLAASIFGASWADERRSVEELDQWVAVVVR